MDFLTQLFIQESFNNDIGLWELTRFSRKFMQHYIASLPNTFDLRLLSSLGDHIETIVGSRGSQTFTWINIYNALPTMSWQGPNGILASLANTSFVSLPPLNHHTYHICF